MNRVTKIILGLTAATALTASIAQAQISYSGGTYSESFDSMTSTGTTTPSGWFVGTGTGAAVAGTTVTVGTGSSTGADNYNFGVTGTNAITDRALGSLASSNGGQRDTELDILNNTGFSITSFTISYDGEQWRSGGTSQVANSLVLQYSPSGVAGSWVSLGSAFNFTTPINGATAGALDGNNAANRVAGIGGTFAPATAILPGQTFYLRWADADNTGTDAGIALDNFSFTAIPEPATYMLMGIGLLLGVQRLRRKQRS